MTELKEIPMEDCLDITYRDDLSIFFIRWKKKVNSEQLRGGYRACLERAKELKNRFWFVDLRKRGPISSEDEQWIFSNFFPEVEEQLAGTHYYAYLVSPTHQHFLERSIGRINKVNVTERTQIQTFNAESHALAWLRKMTLSDSAAN